MFGLFGVPKRDGLIHKDGVPESKIVAVAGWFSAILYVLTVVLLFIGVSLGRPPYLKQLITLLGVFWVIGPPAWFWFEYYFVWDRDTDNFDRLKHGQTLSAAIWLALAAAIAAYLKIV